VEVGALLLRLDVAGIEERLAREHGVGLGHLAAEELDGEAHGYSE
jgi:hypothetical protein